MIANDAQKACAHDAAIARIPNYWQNGSLISGLNGSVYEENLHHFLNCHAELQRLDIPLIDGL